MEIGKVFLVGAGPGDPELLTLKAAKALRSADVVLHDELVSTEILALIPSRTQLINVGKRAGQKSVPQEQINRLLVDHALLGLRVVRLKGGDPFIFGRGGEELEALRRAGIEAEVVPGITAALGASAALQVPLTHREISSTLILVTGSSQKKLNTSITGLRNCLQTQPSWFTCQEAILPHCSNDCLHRGSRQECRAPSFPAPPRSLNKFTSQPSPAFPDRRVWRFRACWW